MQGPLYDPARVATAMGLAEVDVFVVTTAPNVQYLTRYRKPGNAFALLRRANPDQPELFVSAGNISFVFEDPYDGLRIQSFGTFYRDVAPEVELNAREAALLKLHQETRTDASGLQLVAESLDAAGLRSAVVGTDAPTETLARLQAILPDLRIKSMPDVFPRIRMVKTPEEVRRMAEAARITEHAIMTSVQSAFLGATQQHLARVFNLTAATANTQVRMDNASIDGGAAFGNLNTPGDVVQDGSIIRYDVGVLYQGYSSDMARCFAFRTLRDKVRRYHDALVEGQERALELVRPGALPADIFQAAVEGTRRAGIPHFNRSHVGHGLGIAGAGYEPPLLAPGDTTPLEAGMVLCVETPYTEIGFGGLQVEDMVVVTEDGYRPLTHTERRIQVVP